jgi:hypothetical protein
MESGLGQKAFFITLGGPQAHDSYGPAARRAGEMTILFEDTIPRFQELSSRP